MYIFVQDSQRKRFYFITDTRRRFTNNFIILTTVNIFLRKIKMFVEFKHFIVLPFFEIVGSYPKWYKTFNYYKPCFHDSLV